MNTLGITHEPVTPAWRQANGVVERFNQPLRKMLQTAVAEGRIWRQEVSRFLLQYCTTPHIITKIAPSELLFNLKVNGKLPVINRQLAINRHKEARENERKSQAHHSEYANNRRRATKRMISVGDSVFVQQQQNNKLATCFNKAPYMVVSKKGTQFVAENNNGHRITRNVSHFKKLNTNESCPEPESSDSDEEEYLTGKTHDHAQEEGQVQRNLEEAQEGRPRRQRRPPIRFGNPILSQVMR